MVSMNSYSELIRPDQIIELANSFRGAKALMSAVELGVFSALATGPLGLEAIRTRIGIDTRGARDFLDSLVALGLLSRDAGGRYSNTSAADQFLVTGSATYIGAWFDHFRTHEYPQWQGLTKALQTGKAQFAGSAADLYEVLYGQEKGVEAFARAMSGATVLIARQLAAVFPWRRYRTLLDIGTAEGCLPVQIALNHPHIVGGGLDLPSLQAPFEKYVRGHGLSGRLQFHSGDFLSEHLPSADVLIFGRVLHNWDLPTKRVLLAKAHEAVAPGGALIVYERFIDDDRHSSAAGLLASLNMLVMTSGGFEISAAECSGLMREAGFDDLQTNTLGGSQRMVIGFTTKS